MYLCLCNAISEADALDAINAGADSVERLSEKLGIATGCGSCREHAEALLTDRRSLLLAQDTGTAAFPINAYAV